MDDRRGVSALTPQEYLNTKVNRDETVRDFIRASEEEFWMNHENLDEMTVEQIKTHFDFLDYLWEK